MDLRTYLFVNNMSQTKFAKLLDVPVTRIWAMIKNKYRVTIEMAYRMEVVTKGQVTAQDWMVQYGYPTKYDSQAKEIKKDEDHKQDDQDHGLEVRISSESSSDLDPYVLHTPNV